MTDTPPFPALADRAAGAYNSKAFAFGSHMADIFNGELLAVAGNVRHNATEAQGSASAASQAAADAELDRQATAADRIATAADRVQTGLDRVAAQAAAQQIGTAAAFTDSNPVVKGSSDATKMMRFEVDGLTAGTTRVLTVPNKDGTIALLSDLANLTKSTRTANAAIDVADKGTLIDVASGAFTQTLASAATLGNGWSCYYLVSGTGTITLDPNGTELINGGSTFKIFPGWLVLLQCDGTGFSALVLDGGTQQKTMTLSGSTGVGPAGTGSVNTAILRFTTINVSDAKGAFTYTDSATNGMAITINEPGLYALTFSYANVSTPIGISKNSNQLTTPITTISTNTQLCYAGSASQGMACSTVERFAVGDVIRAHGPLGETGFATLNFRITKVGL